MTRDRRGWVGIGRMYGKGLQGKEWEEFRSKEMGKDGIKKEGIEFDQKGWKGKKWK